MKRTVVKGGKAVVDMKTGEVEDTAEIVTTYQVDADRFVKLYTKELKLLFSLTPSAMRLLQVVLDQVQKHIGDDQILLNMRIMENYFAETDQKPVARPTFYRAIGEMVSKGFIAPAAVSKDVFFINPSLFFNGDRLRLVKEYHITRQGEMFPESEEAAPAVENHQTDVEQYIADQQHGEQT